jgi:NAD(P)-dependent dehydrogenase (short-subunit alcohol dehydrogenase family)
MTSGTVLVTGTSSGIGRACAVDLAGRGFHVLAGVRRESDGEAVRTLHPDRIEPLLLDVTDLDAIAKLPDRVGGALAGLVNNAGLSIPGPVEYLSVADIRHQLDVMLLAPFALTHTLLPALRAAQGRVVNIGSIGGRVGLPFISPYNAAKAGIAGMSDSLRQELAPVGVHVALVEPGSIATDIWDRGIAAGDELLEGLPEEGRRLYGRRLELVKKAAAATGRRGVPPAKVAAAVGHALSADKPKTRYLVGSDARGQAVLRAVLPDRALDAVVARVSGVR